MQATFTQPKKEKFNRNHRKSALHCSYLAVCPDSTFSSGYRTPVEIRLYWPAQSTCYACIWVNGKEIHTLGSGSAGGYGYHHESAAAYEAITNAGFKLSEPISGVGDAAIESAVKAIATLLGFPDSLILKVHP